MSNPHSDLLQSLLIDLTDRELASVIGKEFRRRQTLGIICIVNPEEDVITSAMTVDENRNGLFKTSLATQLRAFAEMVKDGEELETRMVEDGEG